MSTTEGSIWKRCTCKDPETGKRYNGTCPGLRRTGGSWHPNHGTWGYQLELPAPIGKRRQLRRGGFDKSENAKDELKLARDLLELADGDTHLAVQIGDLLHACKSGTPLPERDAVAARIRAGVPASVPTTVAEYLDGWLAGRRGLAEKTMRGYQDHVRLYLTPHLGKIPLQKLRLGHIEAMFTALAIRNTEIRAAKTSPDPKVRATFKGVRPMEDASMQRLYATLRVALNHAVIKAKLIPVNPALGVELPSGKPPKARVWTARAVERWQESGHRPSPVMVWMPEQAGRFLDYAQAHCPELYPLYMLILHRGLRRGEACGLRIHDVDLDAGYLAVSQQITTVGYKPITRKVKSDAGDRLIPLGATTVTGLEKYQRMRYRWQLKKGSLWPRTGLFFVQPDGQPWHPQTISYHFDRLVVAAELPPVRLHDLRHCAATYLRHGGADMKEIQELLGHSTMALTSDTYTSVLLELERSNADAAANLIPRKAA